MTNVSWRRAVLDSSVVVKWFREGEVLRSQALYLRSAYLDGKLDLAVPDLLIYELANVLSYKADLSTQDVLSAVASLYAMDLAIVPVTPDLIGRAVLLARQYNVSVSDAAFVSCAESISAPFITADDSFCSQMQGHAGILPLAQVH